jgi:membrane protein YqaA with SNARE-associated domain
MMPSHGATALAFLETLASAPRYRSALIRFFMSFGLLGLFLVSTVDSSFIPLPVPGVTDLMLVIFAARHSNWILLLAVSTAGSTLGGYLSYRVGHAGGMAFLEKRVPPRIFKRVRDGMEKHAVLAIALPAILPPPMPLSPFVLAAGALKMTKEKFLTVFTLSRGVRHALAIWLGIRYGRHVLRMWNHISAEYATPIVIVIWTAIIASCAFAFWKLYKTSHGVNSQAAPAQTGTAA